jgi:hypothetical protein
MKRTWRKVYVFISSTFLDMQAERDYLVRFVFPRLRQELLSRQIHIIDVDLRWGVKSSIDATGICHEIIDKCRPRFICILGGRYGWVPPDKNMSITEDEIHYAVLDNSAKNTGFAYFYFRDDESTVNIDENTPGEFREPEGSKNQKRLNDLKRSIIASGSPVFFYPAKWDNSRRRLTNLKVLSDQVYKDLLLSIDLEFGTSSESIQDFVRDENSAMESFIEEHSEDYTLGSRELILNNIHTQISTLDSSNYLFIFGASGSGKSSLLTYFSRIQNLMNHESVIFISHFVGASYGSTNIRSTLMRLCSELKRSCPKITENIPEETEKLQTMFRHFLEQACLFKTVVILIDGIDQFDFESYPSALKWLPETLPQNARFIISAIDSSVLQYLPKDFKNKRIFQLELLTQDDKMTIIDLYQKRYHKYFKPDQLSAIIQKRDSCKPLYLTALLEELRTLSTYEEINERIASIPSTTEELFKWILRRLEDDDIFRDTSGRCVGRELVRSFSSFLGISQHGLSQQELIELLEKGDPEGNVSALLYILRPYLMRRGELIDFYHNQFRQAAKDSWLESVEQRQAAHKSLALYFTKRLKEPYERSISELPFHLAGAGLEQELIDLISNLTFLRDFVLHFGFFQLLTILNKTKNTLNRGSRLLSVLDRIIDVFKSEAGSFSEWSKDLQIPDFGSQILNKALKSGYPEIFRNKLCDGKCDFAGHVILQWMLGPHDNDIKERLTVSGNRDSYSWDIYDYGPLGCTTRLWFDLNRNRLLTDTISTYGSMDAGQYQDTHEPIEWDLETGILLIRHDSETDEWNSVKSLPTVFMGIAGVTGRGNTDTFSDDLKNFLIKETGINNIEFIGRSANSNEIVFSTTEKNSDSFLGPEYIIRIWVFDPDTNKVYQTSHKESDMTIQRIIKLPNGFTAFATDYMGHIYRLSLSPDELLPEETPVLAVALKDVSGETACVRPDGIEIRNSRTGKLVCFFRGAELEEIQPFTNNSEVPFYVSDSNYSFKITPDKSWILITDKYFRSRVTLSPLANKNLFNNRLYSTVTGDIQKHEWESIPDFIHHASYSNNIHSTFITPSGKYKIEKRRCSIDVWDVQSGKWVGVLGSGPHYGGGGNLYGVAVHPNDRFVISSEEIGGSITVWDLQKNLEFWKLSGIPALGKIKSLTFIWGGYIVVALTENQILYFLSFWHSSEILGAIRINRDCDQIIGTSYGDRVYVLYTNGQISCYRYIPCIGKCVTSIKDHTLDICVRFDGAKKVCVAGTFNNWDTLSDPLVYSVDNYWHIKMDLPEGKYEFKYLVDDNNWELDPNIPFIPAEYGPNNYIEVP